MTKRLFVIMTLGALFSLVSTPAYADTFDLIPANADCNMSVSISVTALAQDIYTMEAEGGANCPGAGVTNISVCVLKQQPNGDYEQAGGACGAGASQNRADASAEIICEGGVNYIGAAVAEQGSMIDRIKTGAVNCPPILP